MEKFYDSIFEDTTELKTHYYDNEEFDTAFYGTILNHFSSSLSPKHTVSPNKVFTISGSSNCNNL